MYKKCAAETKGWKESYAKCKKLAYHCHWQQVTAFTRFFVSVSSPLPMEVHLNVLKIVSMCFCICCSPDVQFLFFFYLPLLFFLSALEAVTLGLAA